MGTVTAVKDEYSLDETIARRKVCSQQGLKVRMEAAQGLLSSDNVRTNEMTFVLIQHKCDDGPLLIYTRFYSALFDHLLFQSRKP
jgi:hypothetical protein